MNPASVPAMEITPAIDRRNGIVFIVMELLLYFSAPVLYVGVVQAAFCERLGASATISNLPFAIFLLGGLFPILCAWWVPAHREKKVMAQAFALAAVSMAVVCLVVFFPAPRWLRIAVVIGQALLIGIITNITNLYMFKGLARGTTEQGRAWALKYGFGFGPIAAVLGSLGAQLLLAEKLPGLRYPYNFGTLYVVALPCLALCAWLGSQFRLGHAPVETAPPLIAYLREGLGDFARDRRLRTTAIGFFLWYVTLGVMTNLSLYTREAVGRAPLELAGLIMALRFGCKAAAGFGLGALAEWRGARVAIIATVVLVGLGTLWPFVSSGYGFLAAFGLMGAGELGGAYFANYMISISTPASTTRNLAFLSLVGPLSSVAPAIHGRLTDVFGFHASFIFGGASAALALIVLFSADHSKSPQAG
jgi:MFS family permease